MRTDNDGGGVGYTGKYPCSKTIRFTLPHFKKTRYVAGSGTTPTLPDDYDYRYGIVIYSRCLAADQTAEGWEVTTRGTTSYGDN
jgi:hypothetical protein